MDYIVREIAKSMDLDPDKVGNNMAQAAVQAEILKKFQEQNPPAEAPPGAPGAPGAAPQAPTGGMPAGGIGTGAAPVPGEQGHSANTGEGSPPGGL